MRIYEYMKQHVLRFRTLYQFGFALLIVAALVIQFAYGIIVAGGITLAYVGLFASYFTILSNILVAVVLCAEARADLMGHELSPRFERLRGLATFCIIATGVTYTLFLRGPGHQGTLQDSIPWINSVFHYVMPIVMAIDWVAFPTKKPVRWWAVLVWIAVTAFYLLYVELLGVFTHSYPYFFVDPTRLQGYAGVARAALGFIPFFLVFGAVVVLANRIRLRYLYRTSHPAGPVYKATQNRL
ncbi:MAG: putative rane protein [Parcubacteria group bacterium]|nr:putative rane protein [Parcubacteria group bacterium]